MPAKMNTITFPCRGGLNLSSNTQELLSTPNEAIKLLNFENSKQGGYRRISGWEQYGDVLPETGDTTGVLNYKGALACRGTGIYHTFDGTYWLQVNKDVANVNEAALSSATVLPRTSGGRYMFDDFTVGTKKYVMMTDGVSNPAIFSIVGDTRATASYRYKEITNGTDLVGAKYCRMVRNQLVVAGMPNDPTSIYYSSVASTDLISPEDDDKEIAQENFNGGTSGFISVGEEVTGIAMQRDVLYVFCERSIHKVQGLDSGSPQVVPVTRDIGCIDGFTIQEMGGDLVYLAPDGLRTIAKTERIDDLELGVISRKIDKLIDPVLSQRTRYKFYSAVIREKNQYRLWFYEPISPATTQKGIIVSYTYNSGGNQFAWAYSELSGLEASCVTSGYHQTQERVLHGNSDGIVAIQDRGNTFGGVRIPYIYQSPFVDLGDISIRKNIHKVFVSNRPEGKVKIGLRLIYDYSNSDVHQPEIFPLAEVALAAIYGQVTYGDPLVTYGSTDLPQQDIFTEGSGHVVSFVIESLGEIDDAPFDIQSLRIELTGGGKL